LDFTLVDGNLVSNIGGVQFLLGERDLKDGHNARELKLIEAFFKWLILVNDGDVRDAVHLMKSLDAVFDELGKFDC